MRAYVVVDLGFGDAGKGLLTDFLSRQCNAGVVVRYNGGAQAGHNVVAPDGRHHTFSQFGSGTFIPGVKTYLSSHVVVHPGALLVEGDLLTRMGIHDAFSRLRISEQALIITPFHQAANRIREMARGKNRHGSCGVGVGETVEDALLNDELCVLAGDLSDPAVLRRKLHSIRDLKRTQLAGLRQASNLCPALAREWEFFEREDIIDAWIASISRVGELGLVTPDSTLQRWLNQEDAVVFEGAQGVLLDADAGFHPYTTWSRSTAANAHDLIRGMAPGAPVFQIGVMRSYAVRHGPGPLPTETGALTSAILEHNQTNEWQGAVRYGWFDAVLARYALRVAGGVDVLAVTHLDVLPRLKKWQYCTHYRGSGQVRETLTGAALPSGSFSDIRLPGGPSLAQREQFTRALFEVAPVLEDCEADEARVIQSIAMLLGQPVGLVSSGTRAENVKMLQALPT